jgi:hypothetical protein
MIKKIKLDRSNFNLCRSPFTRLGPVRTEVSQYFFGTYSSDGKQRISFTFLPSVLVLGEKLGKYRDLLDTSCSSEDPYHRWIHTMNIDRYICICTYRDTPIKIDR